MEFLKELFTEPLSFEAFEAAVKNKGIKLADLSAGDYVSKGKLLDVTKTNQELTQKLEALSTELQSLKEKGANAEDYKAKFEELTRTVEADRLKAEEDKRKADKEARINERFNAVCVGKDGKPLEFSHSAIKSEYLRQFGEALDSEDNIGKSDGEIFHQLTKDDATAFKGVTVETLAGASPMTIGGDKATDTLRKAMGLPDKGD